MSVRQILWVVSATEALVSQTLVASRGFVSLWHPATILTTGISILMIFFFVESLTLVNSLGRSNRGSTKKNIIISAAFIIFSALAFGAFDWIPLTYHIPRAPYYDVLIVNLVGSLVLFFQLEKNLDRN